MLQFNESQLQELQMALEANGGGITTFDGVEVRDLSSTGFQPGEICLVDASKKFKRMVNGNEAFLLAVMSNSGKVKELFISMIGRRTNKHNPDGTPIMEANGLQSFDESKGSMVELWRESRLAEQSAAKLDGKFFLVTNRRVIQTMRPNRTNTGMVPGRQTLYDFWLCSEDGKTIYKADGKTKLSEAEKKEAGIA